MPQTVTIPGVGDVDFPDGMSDAEINVAAGKLYQESVKSQKPSIGSQFLRGATSALPVIGGVLGGTAGTAASPIIGTAAGAGAGAALGEGLRRLINAAILRDPRELKQMPSSMATTGVTTGAGAGILAGLPVAAEALSPSAILSDVERRGTISPGVLGGDAIKRAAAAYRGMSGDGAILSRPAWQAAEPPPGMPTRDLTALSPRLSPQGSSLEDQLRALLDEARGTDTANIPATVSGGMIKGPVKSTFLNPSVDPMQRGAYTATIPDKWGSLIYRKPTADEVKSMIQQVLSRAK